jgi:integrase
MPKRLTTIAVDKAKPSTARYEIPDGGCRGLYLVVQPSGAKSWGVRYRFHGKPQKLTLGGAWPVLTLEHARRDATAALLQLAHGVNPAAAKKAALADARKAIDALAHDTVANLAEQYLEKYVRVKTRPLSQAATERIFRRVVLPAWQGRSVHDIKRRDIIELAESVAFGQPPRPVLANRVLSALRHFFNWLASRDIVAASPCVGVAKPAAEKARERVLDDPEIAALWNACEGLGYPYGPAVRLLLLTGGRRSEVGGLRRDEIDTKTWMWTLPAARSKNKRAHNVPLSSQARAIVETAPRISEFVFGGRSGANQFNLAKAKLNDLVRFAQPWVLHDLRRTVASGMQRIGVPVATIEKVLNHTSGTFSGITGVYQRHDYSREKADALQRWGDHVERVASGKPLGNVRRLRGA